jgi:hypothetical protein
LGFGLGYIAFTVERWRGCISRKKFLGSDRI